MQMSRNIPKLLLIVIVGITPVIIAFSVYVGQEFYDSIFRLSSNKISSSLVSIVPQCKKLEDCKLLPGDILVRRYITSRTWIFDKLAHPYFTHSAFYLGDDQIVEAMGVETNPQDDIQIAIFSKSDWLSPGTDNFIVIRPKNYSWKLDTIQNNFRNIANDPEYTFGIPKKNIQKKTTCADIIFKQLLDENLVQPSNPPKIITPDYLFWIAKNDPTNFEIIGYNI